MHEKRSRPPGSGGRLGELLAVSEGSESVRIEAEPGIGQPRGPDGGGSQRLGWFRSIDDQRLHGEDADSRVEDLAAPVGVGKVAHRLLERHADTPRHHVEQSIDEFDRAGVALGVSRQRHGSNPTESIRRCPAVAQRESEFEMLFLEDHGIAEHALEQAAPRVGAMSRERLPDGGAARLRDAQDGDRTDSAAEVMESIVGLVRKDAPFGLDPAGRQPAGAREEHPEIGVADDGHQERIDCVEGADAVHLDAVHRLHVLGQRHEYISPPGTSVAARWRPALARCRERSQSMRHLHGAIKS